MVPRAAFSFEPGLRPRQPTSAGGSEASCAGNMFAFLAAPERPNTPTGPTSRGGFVFAASPEGPLTPTSRGSNTGRLTFLPSPKQPLTPMCSTASGCEASLMLTGSGAAASLHSAKTARTGSTTRGVGFEFFPPKGTACAKLGSPSSAAAKKTTLPSVGLGAPSFVFSASQTLPPRRGGSRKRPRPNLRIETTDRSMGPRLWEEDMTPLQQQLTPSPQKLAKTNSNVNPAASRSSIMSEPCCAFFASPGKAAKQEQEVEVSSAICSGAELLLRVTCKCGVHKEFSFDHGV
ncbi:hypothetical protein Zm00014a_018835 [Zea mays]|uniref:Uncharacterized protein n=1 Tax=Zea mays TaxID=4577 RepID=A0A317YAW3_MAIZE|nr:hypothetical protein Zm00014a_018835 [Zea mays]